MNRKTKRKQIIYALYAGEEIIAEGANSIAQSYIDLIEGMANEQNKQKQSDQDDG